MSEYIVDVRGKTCPVPLVETRKAIMKSSRGDIIRIMGTHFSSKKEIPMAARAMGLRYEVAAENESQWIITVFR